MLNFLKKIFWKKTRKKVNYEKELFLKLKKKTNKELIRMLIFQLKKNILLENKIKNKK